MNDDGSESSVIRAALRRLERGGAVATASGSGRGRPATKSVSRLPVAPTPVPASAAGRGAPVLTLEPPRRPADPRALATLLADDVAAKLDQLCYVWNVVQELEPFSTPGTPSLRRRAAELFLVAGGGSAEIPLEGPLRAVRSFLAAHGMAERYIETLCEWYLEDRSKRGR